MKSLNEKYIHESRTTPGNIPPVLTFYNQRYLSLRKDRSLKRTWSNLSSKVRSYINGMMNSVQDDVNNTNLDDICGNNCYYHKDVTVSHIQYYPAVIPEEITIEIDKLKAVYSRLLRKVQNLNKLKHHGKSDMYTNFYILNELLNRLNKNDETHNEVLKSFVQGIYFLWKEYKKAKCTKSQRILSNKTKRMKTGNRLIDNILYPEISTENIETILTLERNGDFSDIYNLDESKLIRIEKTREHSLIKQKLKTKHDYRNTTVKRSIDEMKERKKLIGIKSDKYKSKSTPKSDSPNPLVQNQKLNRVEELCLTKVRGELEKTIAVVTTAYKKYEHMNDKVLRKSTVSRQESGINDCKRSSTYGRSLQKICDKIKLKNTTKDKQLLSNKLHPLKENIRCLSKLEKPTSENCIESSNNETCFRHCQLGTWEECHKSVLNINYQQQPNNLVEVIGQLQTMCSNSKSTRIQNKLKKGNLKQAESEESQFLASKLTEQEIKNKCPLYITSDRTDIFQIHSYMNTINMVEYEEHPIITNDLFKQIEVDLIPVYQDSCSTYDFSEIETSFSSLGCESIMEFSDDEYDRFKKFVTDSSLNEVQCGNIGRSQNISQVGLMELEFPFSNYSWCDTKLEHIVKQQVICHIESSQTNSNRKTTLYHNNTGNPKQLSKLKDSSTINHEKYSSSSYDSKQGVLCKNYLDCNNEEPDILQHVLPTKENFDPSIPLPPAPSSQSIESHNVSNEASTETILLTPQNYVPLFNNSNITDIISGHVINKQNEYQDKCVRWLQMTEMKEYYNTPNIEITLENKINRTEDLSRFDLLCVTNKDILVRNKTTFSKENQNNKQQYCCFNEFAHPQDSYTTTISSEVNMNLLDKPFFLLPKNRHKGSRILKPTQLFTPQEIDKMNNNLMKKLIENRNNTDSKNLGMDMPANLFKEPNLEINTIVQPQNLNTEDEFNSFMSLPLIPMNSACVSEATEETMELVIHVTQTNAGNLVANSEITEISQNDIEHQELILKNKKSPIFHETDIEKPQHTDVAQRELTVCMKKFQENTIKIENILEFMDSIEVFKNDVQVNICDLPLPPLPVVTSKQSNLIKMKTTKPVELQDLYQFPQKTNRNINRETLTENRYNEVASILSHLCKADMVAQESNVIKIEQPTMKFYFDSKIPLPPTPDKTTHLSNSTEKLTELQSEFSQPVIDKLQVIEYVNKKNTPHDQIWQRQWDSSEINISLLKEDENTSEQYNGKNIPNIDYISNTSLNPEEIKILIQTLQQESPCTYDNIIQTLETPIVSRCTHMTFTKQCPPKLTCIEDVLIDIKEDKSRVLSKTEKNQVASLKGMIRKNELLQVMELSCIVPETANNKAMEPQIYYSGKHISNLLEEFSKINDKKMYQVEDQTLPQETHNITEQIIETIEIPRANQYSQITLKPPKLIFSEIVVVDTCDSNAEQQSGEHEINTLKQQITQNEKWIERFKKMIMELSCKMSETANAKDTEYANKHTLLSKTDNNSTSSVDVQTLPLRPSITTSQIIGTMEIPVISQHSQVKINANYSEFTSSEISIADVCEDTQDMELRSHYSDKQISNLLEEFSKINEKKMSHVQTLPPKPHDATDQIIQMVEMPIKKFKECVLELTDINQDTQNIKSMEPPVEHAHKYTSTIQEMFSNLDENCISHVEVQTLTSMSYDITDKSIQMVEIPIRSQESQVTLITKCLPQLISSDIIIVDGRKGISGVQTKTKDEEMQNYKESNGEPEKSTEKCKLFVIELSVVNQDTANIKSMEPPIQHADKFTSTCQETTENFDDKYISHVEVQTLTSMSHDTTDKILQTVEIPVVSQESQVTLITKCPPKLTSSDIVIVDVRRDISEVQSKTEDEEMQNCEDSNRKYKKPIKKCKVCVIELSHINNDNKYAKNLKCSEPPAENADIYTSTHQEMFSNLDENYISHVEVQTLTSMSHDITDKSIQTLEIPVVSQDSQVTLMTKCPPKLKCSEIVIVDVRRDISEVQSKTENDEMQNCEDSNRKYKKPIKKCKVCVIELSHINNDNKYAKNIKCSEPPAENADIYTSTHQEMFPNLDENYISHVEVQTLTSISHDITDKSIQTVEIPVVRQESQVTITKRSPKLKSSEIVIVDVRKGICEVQTKTEDEEMQNCEDSNREYKKPIKKCKVCLLEMSDINHDDKNMIDMVSHIEYADKYTSTLQEMLSKLDENYISHVEVQTLPLEEHHNKADQIIQTSEIPVVSQESQVTLMSKCPPKLKSSEIVIVDVRKGISEVQSKTEDQVMQNCEDSNREHKKPIKNCKVCLLELSHINRDDKHMTDMEPHIEYADKYTSTLQEMLSNLDENCISHVEVQTLTSMSHDIIDKSIQTVEIPVVSQESQATITKCPPKLKSSEIVIVDVRKGISEVQTKTEDEEMQNCEDSSREHKKPIKKCKVCLLEMSDINYDDKSMIDMEPHIEYADKYTSTLQEMFSRLDENYLSHVEVQTLPLQEQHNKADQIIQTLEIPVISQHSQMTSKSKYSPKFNFMENVSVHIKNDISPEQSQIEEIEMESLIDNNKICMNSIDKCVMEISHVTSKVAKDMKYHIEYADKYTSTIHESVVKTAEKETYYEVQTLLPESCNSTEQVIQTTETPVLIQHSQMTLKTKCPPQLTFIENVLVDLKEEISLKQSQITKPEIGILKANNNKYKNYSEIQRSKVANITDMKPHLEYANKLTSFHNDDKKTSYVENQTMPQECHNSTSDKVTQTQGVHLVSRHSRLKSRRRKHLPRSCTNFDARQNKKSSNKKLIRCLPPQDMEGPKLETDLKQTGIITDEIMYKVVRKNNDLKICVSTEKKNTLQKYNDKIGSFAKLIPQPNFLDKNKIKSLTKVAALNKNQKSSLETETAETTALSRTIPDKRQKSQSDIENEPFEPLGTLKQIIKTMEGYIGKQNSQIKVTRKKSVSRICSVISRLKYKSITTNVFRHKLKKEQCKIKSALEFNEKVRNKMFTSSKVFDKAHRNISCSSLPPIIEKGTVQELFTTRTPCFMLRQGEPIVDITDSLESNGATDKSDNKPVARAPKFRSLELHKCEEDIEDSNCASNKISNAESSSLNFPHLRSINISPKSSTEQFCLDQESVSYRQWPGYTKRKSNTSFSTTVSSNSKDSPLPVSDSRALVMQAWPNISKNIQFDTKRKSLNKNLTRNKQLKDMEGSMVEKNSKQLGVITNEIIYKFIRKNNDLNINVHTEKDNILEKYNDNTSSFVEFIYEPNILDSTEIKSQTKIQSLNENHKSIQRVGIPINDQCWSNLQGMLPEPDKRQHAQFDIKIESMKKITKDMEVHNVGNQNSQTMGTRKSFARKCSKISRLKSKSDPINLNRHRKKKEHLKTKSTMEFHEKVKSRKFTSSKVFERSQQNKRLRSSLPSKIHNLSSMTVKEIFLTRSPNLIIPGGPSGDVINHSTSNATIFRSDNKPVVWATKFPSSELYKCEEDIEDSDYPSNKISDTESSSLNIPTLRSVSESPRSSTAQSSDEESVASRQWEKNNEFRKSPTSFLTSASSNSNDSLLPTSPGRPRVIEAWLEKKGNNKSNSRRKKTAFKKMLTTNKKTQDLELPLLKNTDSKHGEIIIEDLSLIDYDTTVVTLKPYHIKFNMCDQNVDYKHQNISITSGQDNNRPASQETISLPQEGSNQHDITVEDISLLDYDTTVLTLKPYHIKFDKIDQGCDHILKTCSMPRECSNQNYLIPKSHTSMSKELTSMNHDTTIIKVKPYNKINQSIDNTAKDEKLTLEQEKNRNVIQMTKCSIPRECSTQNYDVKHEEFSITNHDASIIKVKPYNKIKDIDQNIDNPPKEELLALQNVMSRNVSLKTKCSMPRECSKQNYDVKHEELSLKNHDATIIQVKPYNKSKVVDQNIVNSPKDELFALEQEINKNVNSKTKCSKQNYDLKDEELSLKNCDATVIKVKPYNKTNENNQNISQTPKEQESNCATATIPANLKKKSSMLTSINIPFHKTISMEYLNTITADALSENSESHETDFPPSPPRTKQCIKKSITDTIRSNNKSSPDIFTHFQNNLSGGKIKCNMNQKYIAALVPTSKKQKVAMNFKTSLDEIRKCYQVKYSVDSDGMDEDIAIMMDFARKKTHRNKTDIESDEVEINKTVAACVNWAKDVIAEYFSSDGSDANFNKN